MSTINKTFLRVLLAIACCIALAFSLLPQADAAMRANVVTAKVTLNGQVIDNKNAKYPLLSAQHATYVESTLRLYRDGTRANDPNAMMREVAHRLTDAEIAAVSQFVQGLSQ